MTMCRMTDTGVPRLRHGPVRSVRSFLGSMNQGLVGALIALSLIIGLWGQMSEAAQPRSAMIVRNDPGGRLSDRVVEIDRIRSSGTPVRIEGGYCNSACTMYLGLPNTCVSRRASFGFHGPMSQFYGVALPPDQFEYWSQVMASYYPAQLRRWYLREARYTTVGLHKVSGRTLIRMGVRECR